jgi:hypothetical protein
MPSIGPDDAALHPGQTGRASALLFEGLIDDAAMFPPGNAPLDRALSEHLTHRQSWYGDIIGPFLVPAARFSDLVERVAAQASSTPLRAAVVAADGSAQAELTMQAAATSAGVELVAVELPLSATEDLDRDWAAFGSASRAVWWEVDPAVSSRAQLDRQLDRLADAARTAGPGGAKLRTGGTTPAATPDDRTLATFLRHSIDVDLAFKLTAGLHHAVRTTDRATGAEQHGILNVLCGIKAALNGAEEDELEEVLSQRDPAPLVERTHGMSEADASVTRAFWSSFGCCGVTDPVEELAALGLLRRHAQEAS